MTRPWMARHAAAATVVAAALVLAGPASAQTATFVDDTGDVEIWDEDGANPLAEAIDLEALTITASTRRVTITLDVADVLTMSGEHAQEFKAQLIWARRADSWLVNDRVVVLAATDLTDFAPECHGTRTNGGDTVWLTPRVTCSRDVENDTVTVSVPRSVFPRKAKYVRVAAESKSFLWTTEWGGRWSRSSGDSIHSDAWTRFG